MNIKPWIATTFSAVVVSMALTTTAAAAGHHYAVGKSRASHDVFDYARVVSVEPIVRYVTVSTPVKECWDEERHYTVNHRPNRTGGALLGAIIGGVVGHQFGSGRGNDAATVAGSLIGAAVGSESARKRGYERGEYGTHTYSEPVRRCATNIERRQEERVDGYSVVYRYNGQKYRTRLPYDPGDRIRVRVDVRPASG